QTRSISGVGFDVSENAIRIARQMAERVNRAGQANLRFAHITPDDPWPDGEFDLVSIIDVMHHVPIAARPSFMRKAASRVRPGGTLLYKDMCDSPRWRA